MGKYTQGKGARARASGSSVKRLMRFEKQYISNLKHLMLIKLTRLTKKLRKSVDLRLCIFKKSKHATATFTL